LYILGILNSVLKPCLVQRQSQWKVYNILATPSLLYSYEIWTLKQSDIRRLKAEEMKFMRRTAQYNLSDNIIK